MRALLLISLLAVPTAVHGQAAAAPAKPQPPAPQAKPQPAPTAPAQPRATQPRRAAAAARSGIAITVTDPKGATLEGIRVEIVGASDRSDVTNPSGQLNFPALQAGTYRVRFTGDEVIAFEREVTLRAGQVADVDVTLYPAPEREPAPAAVTQPAAPPPTAAAPVTGPVGQPQTLSVVDLLEKEFINRQPRRESLLSCSGNLRTTMIQLNDPQPERVYATGEASYYVLGGEGTIRLNGRDVRLETNGFVSVPRGTPHAFTRRGNRPFVLLSTLSGEPCEQPR